MNRAILLLALIFAPLGCAALGQGFEAYHILTMRNIFDPDRSPMNASAPVSRPRYEAPRAADYIALTGIMVADDRALAFFSGSRSEYDKVVPVNGAIADAKLTKITPVSVDVTRAGKKITVAVGQTLPLDGSAPGIAPTAAGMPAAAPAAGGAPDDTSTPPLPGNLNDVMRRMMERRQQELQ